MLTPQLDVSFESNGDFIGEISVSTPKSSPSREKVVMFEEEEVFIGELAVSTPQKAALDEMSDPDEASYWYAESKGLDNDRSPLRPSASNNQTQHSNNTHEKTEEEEDVPEIGSTSTANNNQKYDAETSNKSMQDQMEVKFYQFMLLMMLRHLFGSWLPGEINPFTTNMFKNKLLTSGGSKSEKREFRKMMTLRKLQYKDNKCEVVPQSKREEDNLTTQIPVIDEYGRIE